MADGQKLMFEQSNRIFRKDVIEKMKRDLFNLIRRYCKSYQVSDFRFELYLHDSTRIEYIVVEIAEVERFISIVNTYWSYFSYLIPNLSFEEERVARELKDRIVGTIDFPKTNLLLLNRQTRSVIVCTSTHKNIFTPENILLASVVLGINLLAAKFLKDGVDKQIQAYLNKIIDYTQFLLKDRILKKLVDYYLSNFENDERLMASINQRIYDTKIKNRYFSLIQFVKEWKNLLWILNERRPPFRKAITPYLDVIDAKLYEMWVFYKIVALFKPVHQRDHHTFVNKKTNFSVVYHQKMNLGWFIERQGISDEVRRYPDVVIKKNGLDLAIIDAKCTLSSEKLDDENQQPSPFRNRRRNIVNQMIIYLDYHGKCDLGLVLFADDKIQKDVVIRQGENRKMLFLNCYPYSGTDLRAFETIKKCIEVI
jgi:septum formation topological specificity factor MinE